jgi:hypothetical protein
VQRVHGSVDVSDAFHCHVVQRVHGSVDLAETSPHFGLKLNQLMSDSRERFF